MRLTAALAALVLLGAALAAAVDTKGADVKGADVKGSDVQGASAQASVMARDSNHNHAKAYAPCEEGDADCTPGQERKDVKGG